MKTRRQHIRETTYRDIRQTARELLVSGGLHAVTINAVARRMGMSGPAIYRYYPSHDDLIAGLTADLYRELTAAIDAARRPGAVSLLPMCRALRHWALANRAGFGLIFATPPLPIGQEGTAREDRLAANAFGMAFFAEIEALWNARRFPVPEPGALEPHLRKQLEAYAASTEGRLPPEAIHVFLNCWIRLYGLLCMEALRQIDFAISDAEPLFEDCLKELSDWLKIDYQPPSQAR